MPGVDLCWHTHHGRHSQLFRRVGEEPRLPIDGLWCLCFAQRRHNLREQRDTSGVAPAQQASHALATPASAYERRRFSVSPAGPVPTVYTSVNEPKRRNRFVKPPAVGTCSQRSRWPDAPNQRGKSASSERSPRRHRPRHIRRSRALPDNAGSHAATASTPRARRCIFPDPRCQRHGPTASIVVPIVVAERLNAFDGVQRPTQKEQTPPSAVKTPMHTVSSYRPPRTPTTSPVNFPREANSAKQKWRLSERLA